jgi:tetratricopeptide (TPR) repeat protein
MTSSEPLPLSRGTRERLDMIGREFLADFLKRELDRHPSNVHALAEYAHVTTRLGRLEEGLQADRQLARLIPGDPTVHYNLACSLALTGRIDEALDALEQAVELGYVDSAYLAADEDLLGLREEPRFQHLVATLTAAAKE